MRLWRIASQKRNSNPGFLKCNRNGFNAYCRNAGYDHCIGSCICRYGCICKKGFDLQRIRDSGLSWCRHAHMQDTVIGIDPAFVVSGCICEKR